MTTHGRADEELKRGTLVRGSEMDTVNGLTDFHTHVNTTCLALNSLLYMIRTAHCVYSEKRETRSPSYGFQKRGLHRGLST
jgi:hypothetical protein